MKAVRDVGGLVSVITPVYNGEPYLAEAIESVLAQTYRPIEHIVVDDGSTDGTRAIVQSYPTVKYLYKTNGGIGSARNAGIREATGKYLAFLDSDNLWMPEKLSLQMAVFHGNPALEIVSGLVEQFVSPGLEQRYSFYAAPIRGYGACAIVLKRAALDRLGWFPEDSITPDVAWIAAMIDRNQEFMVVPQLLVRRRIHGGNTSIVRRAEMTHSMLKDLKHSIDRKRAQVRARHKGS
jgi:glycosyltransferase involved in cell wall biosynthesis